MKFTTDYKLEDFLLDFKTAETDAEQEKYQELLYRSRNTLPWTAMIHFMIFINRVAGIRW